MSSSLLTSRSIMPARSLHREFLCVLPFSLHSDSSGLSSSRARFFSLTLQFARSASNAFCPLFTSYSLAHLWGTLVRILVIPLILSNISLSYNQIPLTCYNYRLSVRSKLHLTSFTALRFFLISSFVANLHHRSAYLSFSKTSLIWLS